MIKTNKIEKINSFGAYFKRLSPISQNPNLIRPIKIYCFENKFLSKIIESRTKIQQGNNLKDSYKQNSS